MDVFKETNFIEETSRDTKRRGIKTHLPLNLIPREVTTKEPHIIYVVRNPKDAAISFYHHHKHLTGFTGSLADFLDDFLAGAPVTGSFFSHVDEYLRLAKERPSNMLVITYEDIVADMTMVVQRVAEFINVPLSGVEVEAMSKYLQFDQMKLRENSNMQNLMDRMAVDKSSEFK